MKAIIHHVTVHTGTTRILPGVVVLDDTDGDDLDKVETAVAYFAKKNGSTLADVEDFDTVTLLEPADWDAAIRREWKIDAIAQRVETEEAYESQEPGSNTLTQRVLLGSLINPSGKYYVPFAASNVAGDCPVCEGRCHVYNPAADKAVRNRARDIDYLLTPRLSKRYGFYADWPTVWQKAICGVRDRQESAASRLTCPMCAGLGSESACDDAEWRTAFDKILLPLKLYLENGEDDSTLYFVCRYTEKPEETEDSNETEDADQTLGG